MKKYDANAIRNICLLSHGGVGKTTLLEAFCYTTKGTAKLNKVANGTSIFDTRVDEKERKMTISMKLGFCEWNNCKINILDTPGFLDLQGDAKAALRVVESAVVLISGIDGVQVGTELMSRFIDEVKMPKLFFVNGMDKENASFDSTIESLKGQYGSGVVPLVIPIGQAHDFKGVVDLVNKEAFEYAKEGSDIGKKIDIPADMAADVDALRSTLMESVAETDESLMNKYFENGELALDELKAGLAKGFAARTIFPVLCGSAALNMGTDVLLNMVTTMCPSPLSRTTATVMQDDAEKTVTLAESQPLAAFVFKTISEEHVGDFNCVRVFCGKLATGKDVFNVNKDVAERISNMYFLRGHEHVDTQEISAGDIGALLKMKDTHTGDTLVEKGIMYSFPPISFTVPLVNFAISSKNKGDEDKVGMGIAKIHEEDPTFIYKYHPDIRQTILSAMGDIHIDIILESLKHRFKVEVEKKVPKISYRETITKAVKYVDYTHKKQSGGAGQFAKVAIDIEPVPRGKGYEFVDKIVGGVIDQSLRPSVDKGIHSKLEEGILAGYPIVDVRVLLVDGKTHPVDSKDIAFQIAGREVFKMAFEQAAPILLEPIANMRITVPDEYTGDVMGDLSSRRGKIGGMEPEGRYQTIVAKVPEAEIQNYSQSLRALSQGRGYFSKSFSHYETVPGDVAKKVIEAHKSTHVEVKE